MYRFLFTGLLMAGVALQTASAQQKLRWWNPAASKERVIQGQGWQQGLASPYDRLPERIKTKVRKPVWDLSREPAGLIVRFRSNAGEIHVRYSVSGSYSRPLMPATGVSGVDLYARDRSGNWEWTAGKYHFGDTVRYDYTHLREPSDGSMRDYYLYLPSHNHLRWLEIGVPQTAKLQGVAPQSKPPIVIYGTSIAQGIASSRPGMTWPAQLGRMLQQPVINLAFSGNGRLEAPLIGLMTELDARLYVLDCMPNVWYPILSSDTVHARLTAAVHHLKAAHPTVPVLLVEDADVTIMPLDTSRYAPYERVNAITRTVFHELQAEGVTGLYLLTAEEIGLNTESTVEGTHPNDHGMWQYAKAYAKKIQDIFAGKP